MKRITFASAIAIFILPILLIQVTRIGLQEQQLRIRLNRDWGFSSGTGKIQGTFSIRANGPDDLNQVIYYLDDQVLGEVNEPPFNLRFVTDNYPVGVHKIHATGRTDRGAELTSNLIQVEFVSAGEGWQSVTNIIIPIGVVILIAVGLSVGVPFIFSRGKKESLPPGAPRHYGIHGGAVCPKCSRPFSRHIYGLNLGTHKYDRCPYCGKWSLVRRATKEELEAAEAAELTAAQEGVFQPQTSEEESLLRDLEDSRFEDSRFED
jgi:DNA-directed RNA polymerase subunit RPC12/RpoP